jgi:hypothetical protein
MSQYHWAAEIGPEGRRAAGTLESAGVSSRGSLGATCRLISEVGNSHTEAQLVNAWHNQI